MFDKKKYMEKWKEEHPNYYKEYRERTKEQKSKYQQEYRKEHHSEISWKGKEYYIKNKEKCIKYSKLHYKEKRIMCFIKISEFRNRDVIQCWRCGEDRYNLLTLSHINSDGKNERLEKTTNKIINEILNGTRTLVDLEVECFSCNWCLGRFGCYPDELPIEMKGISTDSGAKSFLHLNKLVNLRR